MRALTRIASGSWIQLAAATWLMIGCACTSINMTPPPSGTTDASGGDAPGIVADVAPPAAGFHFSDATQTSGLGSLGCQMSWPFDLAVESFYVDGRLDVVLGDHRNVAGGGRNCMARNNGNGTFTATGSFDSPLTGVWSLLPVDYDNDGKIDLSINWDSQNSAAFHNTGSGFTVVSGGSLPFANQSNGMAWSDVDGDGRPDMVTTGFFGNNTLSLAQANGTYANVTASNPVGAVGRTTMAAQLADLNGDGWPDLIVQPFSAGTAGPSGIFDASATHTTKILFNRGAGPGVNPVFAPAAPAGLDTAPGGGLAVGDYDNDGAPDIFAVGSSPGGRATLQVHLFHNDGHGAFTDVTAGSGLPGNSSINVYEVIYLHAAFIDADSDGLLDLFWADSTGQHLYRNVGNHQFTDVTTLVKLDGHAGSSRPVRFSIGDVDGDGAEDVLVQRNVGAGDPGQGITLFHNDLHNDHYIQVKLVGSALKTALGSTVLLYEAGHVGEPAFLRGSRQILQSTSHRRPLEQHFGVDAGKRYDLRVVFWPSRKVVDRAGVTPGQRVTIPEVP